MILSHCRVVRLILEIISGLKQVLTHFDIFWHMYPMFYCISHVSDDQCWESIWVTQVLQKSYFCTMADFIPSVFVQILWRQTRCLSVGPFSFIQSVLSISFCFAQKLAEILFWETFCFFFHYCCCCCCWMCWHDFQEKKKLYFQTLWQSAFYYHHLWWT